MGEREPTAIVTDSDHGQPEQAVAPITAPNSEANSVRPEIIESPALAPNNEILPMDADQVNAIMDAIEGTPVPSNPPLVEDEWSNNKVPSKIWLPEYAKLLCSQEIHVDEKSLSFRVSTDNGIEHFLISKKGCPITIDRSMTQVTKDLQKKYNFGKLGFL